LVGAGCGLGISLVAAILPSRKASHLSPLEAMRDVLPEEIEGVQSDVVISVVQEDNYLYVVSAAGSGVDMKATGKTLIESMIDSDGSGEGEFNEDGTSSGGLWDKFPSAEDDLVADLVAFDAMIYPEPEEEDAS
jgi:hypothetical protein